MKVLHLFCFHIFEFCSDQYSCQFVVFLVRSWLRFIKKIPSFPFIMKRFFQSSLIWPIVLIKSSQYICQQLCWNNVSKLNKHLQLLVLYWTLCMSSLLNRVTSFFLYRVWP